MIACLEPLEISALLRLCPQVTLTGIGCTKQAEAVGELEHDAEHPSLPMAPADARPPTTTRSPAPSSSKPPPGTGGSAFPWWIDVQILTDSCCFGDTKRPQKIGFSLNHCVFAQSAAVIPCWSSLFSSPGHARTHSSNGAAERSSAADQSCIYCCDASVDLV